MSKSFFESDLLKSEAGPWGEWKHFCADLSKKDLVDLIALFKRATVSESITLIFENDHRDSKIDGELFDPMDL